MFAINVLAGNWGDVHVYEMQRLAESIASCFACASEESAIPPLSIAPTHGVSDPPFTAFERGATGEIQIFLNCRGRQWAQFGFQFAHELCHALSNHRPPFHHSCRWIDECLCETASLFALRTMAGQWRTQPPFENWADYADELARYATERIEAPEHQLPNDKNYKTWLKEMLPLFAGNHGMRAENTIVAMRLLPIFEDDREAWRAIRYMYRWDSPEPEDPVAFLESWKAVTPQRLQGLIDRLQSSLSVG